MADIVKSTADQNPDSYANALLCIIQLQFKLLNKKKKKIIG
jgi:hypothetical protein